MDIEKHIKDRITILKSGEMQYFEMSLLPAYKGLKQQFRNFSNELFSRRRELEDLLEILRKDKTEQSEVNNT